jgi:hypothetical protein
MKPSNIFRRSDRIRREPFEEPWHLFLSEIDEKPFGDDDRRTVCRQLVVAIRIRHRRADQGVVVALCSSPLV